MTLRRFAISGRRSFSLDPFVLGRRRRVIHDEIHHPVGANIAETGSEDYWEDFVFANSVVQRWNQILNWNGALFEELFHQLVIAFGDQLDQLFVRFLSLIF